MRVGEVVELLGRVPVFSTLERSDLERIAQLAVPRSFAPGEVVFREGDASDTCYIVREGRARAVRTYRDGRTITLARFGPGDIFLALGVMTGVITQINGAASGASGLRRVIRHVERASKPGLRIYKGYKELAPVLEGLGISIVSTNRGVLSDRQARAQRVGGELLCNVW